MNRPVMPPTTAPIAPMLPAPMPSPMDQIDIFAPAPMANGGVADPYAMEGKIGQSVGPKMVGGTTNVIDASGSNPISSMDDVEMGMANPPLPVTGTGALVSSFDAFLDRKLDRDFADMDRMAAMGNALRASTPMAKMRDFASGILGATQMDGPMGSTIGIRPVARDGNLGIMANFSLPFEDGGPVGMQRGGVTFKSGRTYETGRGIGEQNREMDALERGVPSGVSGDDPYDEFSGGGGDDGSSDDGQSTAEIIAQMNADSENFDPGPGSVLTGTLVSDPASTESVQDFFTNERFKRTEPFTDAEIQRGVEGVMSNLGVSPVTPVAAPIIDFVDPMTDLLAGEPGSPEASDDSLSAALNRLYSTPITNMRSGEKRSAAEDLLIRTGRADMPTDSGGGFPSLAKLAVDVFTGIGQGKAGDIADNIEMGRPAVIDAQTGQITGYVGDGFIKGTKTYTGRAGYDPFGEGATFDPSRNAYVVNRQQPNQSDDERASGQTPATPPPATDSADTTPPPLMITPPTTGLPPSGPSPTDVLVPSTRTNVPVTVPSILPTQGAAPTFLPQSFLDLLASFNRPAPRAMQDGGAVLDKAADDFLEALRVA